jgi:hypothetical protein
LLFGGVLEKQSEKQNQCKEHKPSILKRREPVGSKIQFAPSPLPGQVGFDFDMDLNEGENEDE